MLTEFVPLFKEKISFMIPSTTIQFLITTHWLGLCHMVTLSGKEAKKSHITSHLNTFLPLTKLRLY